MTDTTKLVIWRDGLLFNMIQVSTANDPHASSHSISLGLNGSSLEFAYNIQRNPKLIKFYEELGYQFNPTKQSNRYGFKVTKLYSYDTDAEFMMMLEGADFTKCDPVKLRTVKDRYGEGELVHDRKPHTKILKEGLGIIKKSETQIKRDDEATRLAAQGMVQYKSINPKTKKAFKTVDEAIIALKEMTAEAAAEEEISKKA
jgi:hypothetical protein